MIRRRRLPFVVPQALGDPEGTRVGHQDGEAPGQGDLLGQAGSLGPDGVLGHLAQDGLARLEYVFDPGLRGVPALNIVLVVAHVTPVQHGVLGDPDVDEGRLHAREHVLHPAAVDVPVDLCGVIGRTRHVVLDQGSPLQHGDLGHVRLHVHADQVTAHLLGAALPARTAPAPGSLGPAATLAAVVLPALVGLFDDGFLCRGSPRALHGRYGSSRGSRGIRSARAPRRRRRRNGRRRPGVADLGFALGRLAGRGGRARAGARLLDWTRWGLADFRLGHEGEPSLRSVRPRRRSPARSLGAARSVHRRARSIDAFCRRARAPCRYPGRSGGRSGGHHADAWPEPPGGDHRSRRRRASGWLVGCRRRLRDPSVLG